MKPRKDLSGKKFGRWEVLYYVGNKKWHCKCSCENHTEKDVNAYTLTSGKSVSCGCFAREQYKKVELVKLEHDLENISIGNFTAIKLVRDDIWLCRCNICGNEFELKRKYFVNGKLKSCPNCRNFSKPIVDISGKKFGLWTALYYVGHSKWHCRCDCGNEADVQTSKLIHGQSPKCKNHANNKKPEFPGWFIDDIVDKSLISKINTRSIVEFKCPIHGVYKQRVGDHIRIRDSIKISGCQKCASNLGNKGSNVEYELINFIHINSDTTVEHHNKSLLGGLEIDIYMPKLKIGIEYCGSPFHASEGAIYENKPKDYHYRKFLAAKERGIHLITIFDKYYLENKYRILNIVKSVILGNKLFIPKTDIVYTNNNYDTGLWLLDLGYKDVGHIDSSYFYRNKFLVHECGHTIWRKEGKVNGKSS